MSTYGFDKLMRPASVAIVGASPRAGSLGGIVLDAVLAGGYEGAVSAVNPKHGMIGRTPCVPSLASLPEPPDLVVVATPAHAVPNVIRDAAACGARAAVVLTAGLGRGPGSLGEAVRRQAHAAGLRMVGPNCLGLMSPGAKLNASFATRLPRPGPLALISQSGAIAAGVVEWSLRHKVGFSGVVSLGDALDVDFGDCLDHFAEDPATRAILLYIEAISDARKFMSAARRAARIKPVIVMKAGRHGEGARAAATHTGALAGADEVYDAAFRRAGLLRVRDLDEFFAAALTLAAQPLFAGDRLAILTNGGGLGVLSVDRLMDLGGRLAELEPATLAALDAALPPTWSRANPVDIIGDAPAERYAAALSALLDDAGVDAILAMNCPTALTPAREAAVAVIDTLAARAGASRSLYGPRKPIFGVWLGGDPEVNQLFEEAGIPAYDTESAAIRGIMHLVDASRRRAELSEPVPPLSERIVPDRDAARRAIDPALADGRAWLSPIEVADLLGAYGIPAVPARLAATPAEARRVAAAMLEGGGTCVVKIQSRDIVHKSDVNGVRLGLASAEAVGAATEEILEAARRARPDAAIEGVTVQPMIFKPHGRELIIGMTVDPTFGPVVLFGHGGVAVEVIKDKAVALLPMNPPQARELMARTRIAKLLAGYRNVPAVDEIAIAEILVRLSRLVEDHPEIIGIDLNPLLTDADGAVAIDARVQVADPARTDRTSPSRRFAVRPYPREFEQEAVIADGTALHVRPMRPDDELALRRMLEACDPEDLRMRFFTTARSLNRATIARLTQLDYAREMALVAVEPGSQEIVGVVRLHGDANHETAEYAIITRTDWHGRGLGRDLMRRILGFARAEGYRTIQGSVMSENIRMLRMCAELGFRITPGEPGDDAKAVSLELAPG